MYRERSTFRKRLLVYISFFLVIITFPVFSGDHSSQSGPLFTDAVINGADTALSYWAMQKDEPQVIRKRLVTVNFGRLCQMETPARSAQVRGEQGDKPFHPYLELNLFEDVNLKARVHRVEKVFSGGFSCIGDIEGVPGSEAILVVTGDILSANISVPGHFYQVRYRADGAHAIQEIDQSQFPSELPGVPVQAVNPTEPDPGAAGDSGSYIDILVVYTAEARSAAGGTTAMENLIDLAVSETNSGYGNSGVSQRLRLVHTAEVDYSEAGFNWSTTLTRLRQDGEGYMDDVHTLRDTYGADEVVLIVNDTGYCGIAYVMQVVTTAFAPYAFAVVSRTCATGYYSFAHELGHNMGCAHDRDNASVSGAYSYAYGYQAPDKAFRTIMSYNCPGGCTRVNYWSNPDKQYGGQPMGVDYTDPLAADNRRALNNTAYTVANFRQAGISASITVTSPDGGETLTAGTTHTITWTTSGTVGNVKIEYYNENNLSGVTIVSSTANDGSYNWTVPDDVSSLNLIRISEAADGSPEDYSDSAFSIISAASPTITVTSPNGGETLTVGSTHTITWTTSGTVGNVKIQYLSDTNPGGVTIASSTANDGSYSWTVPDDISSLCVVKISEASDGDPQDSSDNTFSIVSASTPTITVTSPNGGETTAAGSTYTVTWTTTGTVGDVKIQYSTNNGSSWSTAVSSTANDGTYYWSVPEVDSSQCLVKVSEASDGSPSDTSDTVFSVVPASSPTLTVTNPNGGETLSAGDRYTISWTSTGTVGNVKIQYSTNNGSSWQTVVSSTANDGGYSWEVPDVNSSQCKIRISEASDGSPSDTSNNVFSIEPVVVSTLTVTSPNGGESLEAGTSHAVTWSSGGTVGKVKIEYSTDNGSSWSIIKSSAANDGTYSWSVPGAESSRCLVKISEASDGSPSDTSNSVFTIYSPTPPEIALNRTQLYFGADTAGTATGNQSILIDNSGGGTLEWSTGSDASWLSVTPGSGKGSGVISVSVNPSGLAAGTYTGAIAISANDAANSPQNVSVSLKIYNSGSTSDPFGDFSTPTDGSTVRASVPVTGWVIDDIDVKKVKIYNGSDYIGDAVFVEGARPDVENAYPGYPKNYQAGWGYMMLTHFLPGGGNGTYTIYAKATDAEGNQVTLGSKTITVDNAGGGKPFGAIDTPGQGGTASGSSFINWGWVLTPQPNTIPLDGSTIDVIVDGVKIGNPNYNVYRADIAGLFPSYNNSNGAIGYFYLDTTAYENGVHTIQWLAADDAGNTDGIGSRYFAIQNTGNDALDSALAQGRDAGRQVGRGGPSGSPISRDRTITPLWLTRLPGIPADYSTPIRFRKGCNQNIEPQTVYPDDNGNVNIKIRELERIEIRLSPENASFDRCSGFMTAGDRLKPLPVGSSLDIERGVFYWSPGPGFVGKYELVFVDTLRNRLRRVSIEISPRYFFSREER